MSYRLHALSFTYSYFTEAAADFRDNPSADRWMILDRAMKAHQIVALSKEETVREVIEGVPNNEVISRLVTMYDDVHEAVEDAARRGEIRLIKPNVEVEEAA